MVSGNISMPLSLFVHFLDILITPPGCQNAFQVSTARPFFISGNHLAHYEDSGDHLTFCFSNVRHLPIASMVMSYLRTTRTIIYLILFSKST